MSFRLPDEGGTTPYPGLIRLPRSVAAPEAFRLDPHVPSEGVITYDFREVEELHPDAIQGLLRICRKRVVRILIAPDAKPFATLRQMFTSYYLFPADLTDTPDSAHEWLVGERAYQLRQTQQKGMAHHVKTRHPLAFRIGPDTEVRITLANLWKWGLALFLAGSALIGGREIVKNDIQSWFKESSEEKFVTKDQFHKFAQETREALGKIEGGESERRERAKRIEDMVEQMSLRQGVNVPPPVDLHRP